MAFIVLRPGRPAALSAGDLRAHLEPRVACFWVPDAFLVVDAIPTTGVGKFDKRALRALLPEATPEQSIPS
ncbi:MAG TPA: hypothetical protein VMW47_00345 [Verrucomicrobiae bacterium]|nr:hypothetical protein [Verrucomicrobiae bacterium]